jgi:hypothetical protein
MRKLDKKDVFVKFAAFFSLPHRVDSSRRRLTHAGDSGKREIPQALFTLRGSRPTPPRGNQLVDFIAEKQQLQRKEPKEKRLFTVTASCSAF